MKDMTILVSSLCAMLMTASVAQAKEDAPGAPSTDAQKTEKAVKTQTLCPVMGGPINKKLYVDYDGKRIYVCCKGCIATVKKDPAKYVKQLESEGITLDKAEPAKAK